MLSRLTSRSAVIEALNDFDEKGRDQFLADSNFGASKRYFVRWEGRLYDAKAVAGRALELQHADLSDLPHDAFHGGTPVKRRLKELGFKVVLTSSSSRDESSSSEENPSPASGDGRSRLTVGQRVRHIRAVLAMTQEELGEELSVHRGTISAWETERDEPREDHVRAIADLVEPSDRAFRWLTLERKTQPTLHAKGSAKTSSSGGGKTDTDSAATRVSPPHPPGGSADWPNRAGIFDDKDSIAIARRELLNWMVEVVDEQPEAAVYATSVVNMFNAAVQRIEKLDGT